MNPFYFTAPCWQEFLNSHNPVSNRELITSNPLHWFAFPCWLIQAPSLMFQSQLTPLSPRRAQPPINTTNLSAVRRNNPCHCIIRKIFGQNDSFIRLSCGSPSGFISIKKCIEISRRSHMISFIQICPFISLIPILILFQRNPRALSVPLLRLRPCVRGRVILGDVMALWSLNILFNSPRCPPRSHLRHPDVHLLAVHCESTQLPRPRQPAESPKYRSGAQNNSSRQLCYDFFDFIRPSVLSHELKIIWKFRSLEWTHCENHSKSIHFQWYSESIY